MSDRFNKLDNTAPVVDPLNNPEINVPRSAFNLSCMKYFNGLIGAIMPFDVIRTLPNSTYNISYDVLCKLRNPLVRPLLSGMRIYLHTYYNRDSDLWEGANNFYTKGRSGNITMSKPVYNTRLDIPTGGYLNTLTPFSPLAFMGVPAEYYQPNVGKNSFLPVIEEANYKVNSIHSNIDALPLVMYQRLCRDKYYNKNLLQNNKNYLPDNEDHFILPYNCSTVDVLDYDSPIHSLQPQLIVDMQNPDSAYYVPKNHTGNDEDKVFLNSLHFRQFKGDYFTSALPFPDLIRGTAPTINISDISGYINWDNVLGNTFDTSTNFKVTVSGTAHTLATDNSADRTSSLKAALNKATVEGVASGSLNLNDFRALEAYTIFMERNARTDGDYDSLIKAQFGYNPHTGNREAIYVGGSYQDLVFSDVTQTSQSTEASPMGSRVGQGISASSGYIGKFNSPDYGYLMTVMTIVPDTIYTQELDRSWTCINQADQYYPILNNLSPQPILNKELFTSGNNTTDNDIFGYTERFSEFKSRRSKAMGLIALPHSKATYDASSIMARRFNTTPTLSNDFMTMSPKNIDMNIFSVSDEVPFDLSVACRCDAVLPMPYITVPGGLNARA